MLELKNIYKRLGDFSLEDINLNVKEKEYYIILGLSGTGKSVLLEMIAGLISPDKGVIVDNGIDITNSKIHERNIGILFQDYAVFPHKNVLENICYPLRNNGIRKKEVLKLAMEYATEMSIEHLLKRMPATLSGGELQRVALARTLALKPKLLLLDEPLSSVDVQLKDELRILLRKINRKGITIIHVTHNYEEAISLAERISVMHEGRLIQTGTTKEVFHNPKSEFIAYFTGIKNFYNATHTEDNTSMAEGKVSIKHLNNPKANNGYLIFRSEDIILSKQKNQSSALNNFHGKVLDHFPSANGIEILVDIKIKISAHISYDSMEKLNLSIGDNVWVSFKASAVKFIEHY